MSDFALEHREDPLGSLIADSYVYAVRQAEGEDYEKVDVAISPAGTIRETFQKGNITVSDAFNVSSLGIGADRIPGYPLVSVYLTGKELKTIAEIDVSISPIMTTAQLYPSGLRWTYNPNRLLLNRVTDVEFVTELKTIAEIDVSISPIMTTAQLYPSGLRWTYNPNRLLLNRVTDVEFVTNIPYTNGQERTTVEDGKLYRVVAGLYSAQMLGTIEDTSMGLLKLAPKDKDGNVITDFESCIIHDQNGTEVKEWYALASYLESFDTNENGVPEIPAYYAAAEGRKQLDDSHNIIDLLKNPNKFAWMLYGVILLLVLLVVGIVKFIQKRRKRKNIVKKQKL